MKKIKILYLDGETNSDIIRELIITENEYVLIGKDKLLRLVKEQVEGYLSSKEYKLSSRENEILALVSQGLSNKEIANQLNISSNTVRNHIYNICKKMGVGSRLEILKNVSRETFFWNY